MWKSSYNSIIWSKYFFCIFALATHILHVSSGYNTWFITMLWTSMSNFANYWINLSVSYIERNSGMQTATNVVLSLSFIWAFTNFDVSCIFYSLLNSLSKPVLSSSWEPKIPTIPDIMDPNLSFNVSILLRPFSMTVGKFKKRSVWPVGAVSKTITSKSIFSIELNYEERILDKLIERHSLIYAWNRTHNFIEKGFCSLVTSEL